jgi:hypothetical protein
LNIPSEPVKHSSITYKIGDMNLEKINMAPICDSSNLQDGHSSPFEAMPHHIDITLTYKVPTDEMMQCLGMYAFMHTNPQITGWII